MLFFVFFKFLCLKNNKEVIVYYVRAAGSSVVYDLFLISLRVLIFNDGLNVVHHSEVEIRIILEFKEIAPIPVSSNSMARCPLHVVDHLSPCGIIESGKIHCPLVCHCWLVRIIALLYVTVGW